MTLKKVWENEWSLGETRGGRDMAQMNVVKTVIIHFLILLMAAGCASSRSGKVYSRDEARKPHTVKMGTVESVGEVEIEGTKSTLGVVAGGILGGVVGSSIGHGSGTAIAIAVGAIAGGAAGGAVEEQSTRRDGLEITVRLEDGKTIAIVQEADESFNVGDPVRVLTAPDGTTRVRH
jgi:outer membrane lipoprotein SlyB